MLNIYYGDGLTDKERFIFDHIDPAKKTILLVPDQFSLQTEQDAFRFLDRRALTDLMVTDFSALGHKVVKETEGHEPRIIDKYGRHMLLSILIERVDDQLTIYRGRKSRRALAEQMNTMISELKRYEVTPDDLEEVIAALKEGPGSYLVLKLEDMLTIYRAYEDAISGIYRDAEDYITYYADRITGSSLIRDAQVWIYGFDTFTPKNLMVIRSLLAAAASVSVVMTYEDGSQPPAPARALTSGGGDGLFRLTEMMMQRLVKTAEECGQETAILPISGYPLRTMWAAGSTEGQLRERIRLARTSGSTEEAESAAAYIQTLVRDEGYRYGDIAVLCNDMDGRGRELLRTFERWEIPVFADQKRKALHQPVVSFLLSFLDVLTDGFGGEAVLGMVKSGLIGWADEDEALLENYVKEFRIRGGRWQREFAWTGDSYTEEEMDRVNGMREFLVSFSSRAKDAIGRRNTAAGKVNGLITFLEEELGIVGKIEEITIRQQELGLIEGAAETAQIWNAICGILEQIIQVVGDEKISNAVLRDMITAGLENLEIGLVPASRDCVLIGTLQRSRPGRIRALVVTGANAGLLPLDVTDEGLLSRREKARLEEMELEFAGREKLAQMEEQLAIYRMFSMPGEKLYVSCSMSGSDGGMLRPSDVFRQLQRWQPAAEGDLNEREFTERIASAQATVPYLADALRSEAAGEAIDPGWSEVCHWYEEKAPEATDRLRQGVDFNNRKEALGEDFADALFRGDVPQLEVSASRLELFSGCPFAHFIQYGLRAREQRLFEAGGREIGDIYHRCMMEFSRQLQAATEENGGRGVEGLPGQGTEGLPGQEAGEEGRGGRPDWETVTEAECRQMISEILSGSVEGYREGLFGADGDSRFRMHRITEICGDVAWALVHQVRQGRIRKMYFEESFGRGRRLPAIEVMAGDRKVLIRGTIDRMDVIDAGPDQLEAVRIVDYKTGSNTIRTEDFESGYKLQLMVYMDAATAGGPAEEQPAGVFYFKIKDIMTDADQSGKVPDAANPEELELRLRKDYRMEGILINDPALIGAMDEAVDGSDKAESTVIPVKYDPKKEEYTKTGGGTLLTGEEFRSLMEETNRQVERICGELCRGEIAAIPKREKGKDMDGNRITACRYCGYRSICMFDPGFRGCRYDDVN